MTRRIGISDIGFALVRASYRRLAVELGAPARTINLATSRIPEFAAYPKNLGLGQVANGLKILDGQFVLGGHSLDIGAHGDPWVVSAPSEPFAHRLHSFNWLNDLAALRADAKLSRKDPQISETAATRAQQLVDGWIASFGKWNPYTWENDILVNRVFAWFANWQSVLDGDSDTQAASARRVSLYRQLKRIRSTYKRTPAGLPRLKAAACLVLGGACFADKQDGILDKGLDVLDDEIEVQILADGGHISRCPEQAALALEILVITESALEARGAQGSKEIQRAIDRLAPMIDFFTASDGELFGFNGGGTADAAFLKKLVAQSRLNTKPTRPRREFRVSTRPFGYAPHTKFQRLDRNGTVLMIDVGTSPPRPYDLEAHLAPLAFEMSTDAGRLIVNCGWNETQPQSWRQPMRMTAAHTTLILDRQNAGHLQKPGLASRVLGPAIAREAGPVQCSRQEQETGTWLEAVHEGYRQEFGVNHRRRLYMDLIGADIRGEDTLFVPMGEVPLTREEIPFDIRFHLHPDVKVTLAQDQKSALLIQEGGHGWRFRTDAGPLRLEKSVYLAKDSRPHRAEQIVISGRAYGDGDGQTRSNRIRWSLKRLGGIDTADLSHSVQK
ncbi:MAG: heparinase [Robiginitomaculum sp.]|nr:MAG: heparinase [Robiginitomaculum sp.]